MYKIHCLNNISQSGLSVLPNTYKISDQIKESDAILVRSFNMHELNLDEAVLAVARAGAGVNNIPIDKYAEQGVLVFNTPGANANAVKELTLAGMFMAARNINAGISWIKENHHDPDIQKNIEKAKNQFAGTEVLGKTIGIIGLGAIGLMLAKSCAALGMHVIGTKRNLDSLKDEDLPKDMELTKNIEDVYQKADFISLNLPLSEQTKHMIDQKAFNQMKDGVIILNFARDKLVHDDDLEVYLKNGKIRAYVTDFPNPKTANLENVIAIPHLGASSLEAEDNCASMASLQIKDYLEQGIIKNSVNYPDIKLPLKNCKSRVSILYQVQESMREKIVGNILSNIPNIAHAYQAYHNGCGSIVVDSNEIVTSKLTTYMKNCAYIKRIRVI